MRCSSCAPLAFATLLCSESSRAPWTLRQRRPRHEVAVLEPIANNCHATRCQHQQLHAARWWLNNRIAPVDSPSHSWHQRVFAHSLPLARTAAAQVWQASFHAVSVHAASLPSHTFAHASRSAAATSSANRSSSSSTHLNQSPVCPIPACLAMRIMSSRVTGLDPAHFGHASREVWQSLRTRRRSAPAPSSSSRLRGL